LTSCWRHPAAKVKSHQQIPEAPGIYLFSELDHAIYVGQTRKPRQRLRNHTSPLGKNNQATFAFLIAKAEAGKTGVDVKQFREQLEADEDFLAHFDAAKVRVSEMDVGWIDLARPIVRSFFQIYAALALETLVFKAFETH
jgi:hypothetical protein